MEKAETPQSCVEHQDKYKAQAWEGYTLSELGDWVHLFAKRSEHRMDFTKREKDLTDAQNYLNMMQSKLDALKSTCRDKYGDEQKEHFRNNL